MNQFKVTYLLFLLCVGCERASAPEVSPQTDLPLTPDFVVASIPDFAIGIEPVVVSEFSISNVEFHPALPILYLIGVNGMIDSYDLETGELRKTVNLSEKDEVYPLMDLTFHPDYANNGRLYMAYVTRVNDVLSSRVSEFTMVGEPASAVEIDRESERVILEWAQVTNDSHNVNHLEFGPHDNMLYVTSGDGGCCFDSLRNSQNTSTFLGKTLRIDVDNASGGKPYSIPGNNPLVGVEGANEAVLAYGLRNPYRMVFDDLGNLLVFDVGNGGREEIDLIRANEVTSHNFGWITFEGTRCIGDPEECDGASQKFTPPIFELKHPYAKAVIGGRYYQASDIPELQGQLIFGDHNLGKIWSLSVNTSTGYVWNFMELNTAFKMADGQLVQSGLVSVNNDPGGNIYLVYLTGEVFRFKAVD